MQISRLVPFVVAVFLPIIACTDAASPARPAALPAETRPPTIVILGWPEIVTGQEGWVTSRLTAANGTPLRDTPTAFRSSDTAIAVIESVSSYYDGSQARIRGVGAGTTTVTANALGRTTSARVKVLALAPGPSSVIVEDFHVVEFQHSTGGSSYAPQLRMRDTTGNTGARVMRVTFLIPPAALHCTMSRPIGAVPFQLFPEIYGDYELMIGMGGDGRTLAGQRVTAQVTVGLDDSVATVLTATGLIVRGSLPSTYTGGTSDDMDCRY